MFAAGDFQIETRIKRADFEAWIADDLARIAAALDEALRNAAVRAGEIDKVFLTGGTSFVPAVRRLFEQRFARRPHRIRRRAALHRQRPGADRRAGRYRRLDGATRAGLRRGHSPEPLAYSVERCVRRFTPTSNPSLSHCLDSR